MEDVNKQRRNFISITVLGYGAYRNSTLGGFAYVLIAVASLELKIPNVSRLYCHGC